MPKKFLRVTDEVKRSRMEDGTVTKAFYVKNLPMSDWNLVETLMDQNNFKTLVEVLRFSLRKASGVI